MKYYLLTSMLCFVFFQSPAQNNDEAQIKSCFAGYKKAILAEEGKKAVRFLSDKTIQYIIVKKVLKGGMFCSTN